MCSEEIKVIDHIIHAAETQFRNSVQQFIKQYEMILKKYDQLVSKLFDEKNKLSSELFSLSDKNERLLENLNDTKKWLNSISNISEIISGELERSQFIESLEEKLVDLPMVTTLVIPVNFLAKKNDNTIFNTYVKIKMLIIIHLKVNIISIGNRFRSLTGKPPFKKYQAIRSFNTHNFLKRFLIIRALQYYDSEEQKYIKAVSDQIGKLQDSADRLYSFLTSIGLKKEHALTLNAPIDSVDVDIVSEHHEIIQALFSEVDSIEENACQQFSILINQLAQDTKDKYEFAGTLFLPENKFSEKTIYALNKTLNYRRTKNAKLWDNHLHGLEEV